jgi:hypothetical protein
MDVLENIDSALGCIEFSVNKKRRQICISCEEFPFRLMFKTGPNNNFSCRFALGFLAEDYDSSHMQIGQAMVVELRLDLPPKQLDILVTELFIRFDADGSGSFEFEEFRDFYIKLLDTKEALKLLQDYAKYRFRDKKKEQFYAQVQKDKNKKKLRRLRMAGVQNEIKRLQKIKSMNMDINIESEDGKNIFKLFI